MHSDGWAAQVQCVGQSAGEEVPAAGEPELFVRCLREPVPLRAQHGVMVRFTTPGIHTDGTRVGVGVVASVFQCLPSAFEENSTLRVEQLCIPRRDPEKRGIEPFGVGDYPVRASGVEAGGQITAGDERGPEFVEVRDAGYPGSHSDDRHGGLHVLVGRRSGHSFRPTERTNPPPPILRQSLWCIRQRQTSDP